MMHDHDRTIGGIVLCGGRSTRMGRPKHALPFGPETMLQRTVRTLQAAVSPVVVVAAQYQTLPTLPDSVVVVRDEQEDLGPLGGMAVGLAALRSQVEAAYVSGCDVPLLQPEFVRHMVDLLGDHDLVMPRDGEHHHPLAAVYRTALADRVRAMIAAGRMRPVDLIDQCRSRIVDVEELRELDPQLDSLRNANTPAEYRAALQDAGHRDSLEWVPQNAPSGGRGSCRAADEA